MSSTHNLPHHYAFINDGRLSPTPTVRYLLRYLEPAGPETSCTDVMERFITDDALYALPIVDAARKPLALVDRNHFIEFYGKPYCKEIFGAHGIMGLLDYNAYGSTTPITVDDSCSVEDVAKIVVDAGVEHMVTGFLITSQGRYAGVANGHDLLNSITQRKQAELYHLAHYDNLTGIPNRMLLNDRLEKACRDADRRKNLLALLFIDVDRFKRINDSLGHSAGDVVLCQVVERLKASARRTDTVARLAGDEFVILMEDLADITAVQQVAQRLVQLMKEPVTVLGHSLLVTVSVGSAIYPLDDTDAGALLNKADAAMYNAKATGRNSHCVYSPDTALYNPASLLIVNDLRQAIERSELILHYQPQVDLLSGAVLGLEALVRWQHPALGLIPPAQFIHVAEESGLIVALGEAVLRQAFRQMQAWSARGMHRLRISINISAHQLNRAGFAGGLKALLDEFGIDPQTVELELTESVLMHHQGGVLATLEEIKNLGMHLSIDDFGTGFSSLSYLRRFPIDRLKIDQSFVRDIHFTPVNKSIAGAIVALAKSLSLEVIAEGVEKTAEKEVIEELGCREAQGHLFSAALPPEQLIAWLTLHGIRNLDHGGARLASTG